MLSMQFEQSIEEMVEHGWDEEVARKALLMQWQKDIEGRGGSRKDQKQFEKTVQVGGPFFSLFCGTLFSISFVGPFFQSLKWDPFQSLLWDPLFNSLLEY